MWDESLKALHYDRCQGYWSIVIETPDCLLLGYRDYSGGFEVCGDYTLLQGQIEDSGEDPCLLVST